MYLATLVLLTACAGDDSVKITRQPLCPGEISPLQYGQFIEYLCDLVPSMWAEKLYDGSFEGPSPYRGMEYLKQTDFREKPWYPSLATNRAEYSLDPNDPVSGKVSQKIHVPTGPPATVGLSQDGIFLEKDKAYELSCYVRSRDLHFPLQFKLHRLGQALGGVQVIPSWDSWHRITARIVPSATVTDATLTISFRGPGTLWMDNISLMPEETVGGWRPDVVEAIRAVKPGVIRFGGSALDDKNLGEFEWRDTVGPVEKRKPFRAWGGLQPAAAGLEEIVQLSKAVGAEPLICVRVSRRQPKDAAEEIEYFNGSPESPQGSLRARNGHREPYSIKYWQIGNELAGPDYEAHVAAFAEAMKKADPSIKLLSSYPREGVFRKAGNLLDYACPHHYGCHELDRMIADFANIRAMLKRVVPDRAIKIAVTEWNTTGGHAGPRRAMLWSLANALACSRYHNLLHHQADMVEIANRSNLCNSFCSGIIQTNNHTLYKTPTYYAQQLYATLGGNRPLQIEGTPGVDLSATLSANGDTVTIFAVNDGLEPITRTLDFSQFGNASQDVKSWVLADSQAAGEPEVANSFAEPERVRVEHVTLNGRAPKFDHRFPPLTLTVIRWEVRQ
jgi:alpha-N-arabinofuranosidase